MYTCKKRIFQLAFYFLAMNLGLNGLMAENPVANNVFHSISLTTAKNQAASEGKRVFVEFYANWCVPCKWMEETSFSDFQVQEILKEEYIAVRVDIDDFDGYALKRLYAIQTLPTILILDANGKTLERREQSLTAPMLIELLQGKNSMGKSTRPVNLSPSQLAAQGPVEEMNQNTRNVENKNKPAIVEPTSYRVQVGVYTDYANTKRMVEKLRLQIDEPVMVFNDYLNDTTVFRVMVGDCSSRREAEKLKNLLRQNHGIEGLVK